VRKTRRCKFGKDNIYGEHRKIENRNRFGRDKFIYACAHGVNNNRSEEIEVMLRVVPLYNRKPTTTRVVQTPLHRVIDKCERVSLFFYKTYVFTRVETNKNDIIIDTVSRFMYGHVRYTCAHSRIDINRFVIKKKKNKKPFTVN